MKLRFEMTGHGMSVSSELLQLEFQRICIPKSNFLFHKVTQERQTYKNNPGMVKFSTRQRQSPQLRRREMVFNHCFNVVTILKVCDSQCIILHWCSLRHLVPVSQNLCICLQSLPRKYFPRFSITFQDFLGLKAS